MRDIKDRAWTKMRRSQKYEGADPYKETLEAMNAGGFKTYGPLKALSEKEAEKWFPGKTLIIRPGINRRAARRDRSFHLLAGADRSRRRSARARQARRSGAIHRWARSGGMDDSHGRKMARPEFTTRPVRPNRSALAECSMESKTPMKSNANVHLGERRIFSSNKRCEAWSDMPVWAGRRSADSRARTSIAR